MEHHTDSVEVVLPYQRLLCIRDGEGLIIEVVEGHLWVTRERDREDHVVKSGQSITIEHTGLTLVSALKAARFRLHKSAAADNPMIDIDGQGAPAKYPRALASVPERVRAAPVLVRGKRIAEIDRDSALAMAGSARRFQNLRA